jgi:hypothetical protein
MKNFRDVYGRFTQILGFVMVFVYAAMGLVFLLKPEFYAVFKGTPRIILGVLLILYAVYRGYRVFLYNKN